jgi:hypothetical protein
MGGPLRRRREKRQLQQLAENMSRREPSPMADRKHVSVIEDQNALKRWEPEGNAPDAPSEPLGDMRSRGFHVRPIPIDQPFDETSSASSETTDDDGTVT